MSTTRRRLGTGPSTTQNTSSADSALRLLPAERLGPEQRLDDDEHQAPPDPKGRRALGPGTAR
ncbi:hypothetical protein [Streptomyces anulatus]|uniref:hypothetical protein n=1 Tax=Streptomyces anulatus TaxID=1892 RepID=UPI00324374C3